MGYGGLRPSLAPRRLRRGCDVVTEDGAVAVDTEWVSAASDAVVPRETQNNSECVPTVVPKLAAAPQAASEVILPRPPDSGCTDLLPPVDVCRELLGLGTPDAVESGMEVAGGIPPAEIDISVNPDMLPTATSVTTEVSEEWMEIDTPDTVESGMEITGGSPPAVSVEPDVLQTAISVTTQVSEKCMVIDTPDPGGSPPAVSDISVDADVLQTAIYVTTQVSEKWMMFDSPDAVESGMVMAGESPPAEVDISVGPDVLLTAISVTTVVSEKLMERFVMDLDVLCSDGLTSGDDPAKESSDVGSDVCVVSDSMPTAVSVRTVVTEKWMDRFVMYLVECPSVVFLHFQQLYHDIFQLNIPYCVDIINNKCSGPDVRAGRPCLRRIPLLFLLGGGRLPMHTPLLSLSQIQRECLSCLLPVVSSQPFFWGRSPLMWSVWALRIASETIRMIRTHLRQMNGFTRIIGAMCDCWTVGVCPQLDSAAADCGAVELVDLIVRRTSFPPDELSAGRDRIYMIDCNTVWGFPHIDSAAADCGAVDLIFRHTSFPPHDLSAGRDGDYIWRDLWTGPSVCNRSVMGSLTFGSSQRLGGCCLWLAALPVSWIGSAEVPLCHHLFPAVSRSASHEVEAPFHSPLCRHPVGPAGGNVFAELSMHDLVIFLDSPLCRHPVWPDGGSVFAGLDMSLYDPCLCMCRQLLAFDPAVHRTTSGEGEMYSLPPYF